MSKASLACFLASWTFGAWFSTNVVIASFTSFLDSSPDFGAYNTAAIMPPTTPAIKPSPKHNESFFLHIVIPRLSFYFSKYYHALNFYTSYTLRLFL